MASWDWELILVLVLYYTLQASHFNNNREWKSGAVLLFRLLFLFDMLFLVNIIIIMKSRVGKRTSNVKKKISTLDAIYPQNLICLVAELTLYILLQSIPSDLMFFCFFFNLQVDVHASTHSIIWWTLAI